MSTKPNLIRKTVPRFGTEQPTRHHVPPRHPDPQPKIIIKDQRHHRAYHLLFGAAASLEDCVHILKRDWWPDSP